MTMRSTNHRRGERGKHLHRLLLQPHMQRWSRMMPAHQSHRMHLQHGRQSIVSILMNVFPL